MKTMDELNKQNINKIVEQCYKSVHLGEITQRTMEILDAKYERAELKSTIVSKLLTSQERKEPLYSNYFFVMKTYSMAH
jgi:hypothetical protein